MLLTRNLLPSSLPLSPAAQGGARFLYASAARLAVINTIATLSASADVLALAAVEVDLANVQPGQVITVKWRGKPVFIKNRTADQVSAEAATPTAGMRHPQTDAERVKNPQWCVLSRGVRTGFLRPLLRSGAGPVLLRPALQLGRHAAAALDSSPAVTFLPRFSLPFLLPRCAG